MKATPHYQNRLAALRSSVRRHLASRSPHDPAQVSAEFLHCRASQRYFLPEHPVAPADFFEDVLTYRGWAGLDELEDEVYFLTQFTGDQSFLDDIRERPRIFCTFHLGSYRMIHHYLLRHKVDFTLVIDHNTYTQQGEKFLDLQTSNPAYCDADFRILDAEQRTGGIQMIRELKAGRSLLFYIDGNSGVGGMGRQDDKVALVDFLGQRLFARKGIAYIAHATSTPIVPLVSFRHADDAFETHFFPAMLPDAAQPRDAYAQATTQAIFRLFEPVLSRYPAQWEGWLYMHHFVDVSPRDAAPVPAFAPEQAEHLCFNEDRYTVFWQHEQPHLFDDGSYQAFRISAPLAAALQGLSQQPAGYKHRLAASPLFAELLQRRVLTVQVPAVLQPAAH